MTKKLKEVGIEILCEEVAQCKPLREIAKKYGVSFGGLSEFLTAHTEQYARARESQADKMAEEILAIADDTNGDSNRDRLRVDARKWLASKMGPRRYSDKISAEVTGAIATIAMDDKTLAAKMAGLLALANLRNGD